MIYAFERILVYMHVYAGPVVLADMTTYAKQTGTCPCRALLHIHTAVQLDAWIIPCNEYRMNTQCHLENDQICYI